MLNAMGAGNIDILKILINGEYSKLPSSVKFDSEYDADSNWEHLYKDSLCDYSYNYPSQVVEYLNSIGIHFAEPEEEEDC
jgi:hypothetical protein